MEQLPTEKPVYVLTNYIYQFIVANLLFAASNLLFLLVLVFVPLVPEHTIFLFLGLLPLSPALGALFYTMGKLSRTGEAEPFRDYFAGYRKNFKISAVFGTLQLAFLFLLLINIAIVGNESLLFPFFLVLMILTLLLGCYAFSILSRFEIGLKSLFAASLFGLFKRKKQTLVLLVILIFSFYLYITQIFTAIFFFTAPIVYLVVLTLKTVMKSLEEN